MASRSGPGQAKSMTLLRSFSNAMILRKMMGLTLVLLPSPVPWHALRHAPLQIHWQNAALIFAYRLGRRNVEATAITTHEVTEMDNHVGLSMTFNTISSIHSYMQRTATPMTSAHGDCILLLFSRQKPPLPPLRIQPGQRLLNNIPQLVKPH